MWNFVSSLTLPSNPWESNSSWETVFVGDEVNVEAGGQQRVFVLVVFINMVDTQQVTNMSENMSVLDGSSGK